jgi:hypothetical protein
MFMNTHIFLFGTFQRYVVPFLDFSASASLMFAAYSSIASCEALRSQS